MTTQSRATERDRAVDRPQSDRPGADGPADLAKRAAAAVLGGVLLVWGLGRRSLRGVATALAGGWLLSRALGGPPWGGRTHRARRGGGRVRRLGTGGAATGSRSIVVGRPADELYDVWRDPDQLSRIMGHFADVTAPDDDRLRWTVHGPRGRDVAWDSRVVEAEPGAYLRWESAENAPVSNRGTVRFSPASGDRGTRVTLSLGFGPPGTTFGNATLRRLDVVPAELAGVALDRFKSLVESGEIPTLEGNPSARGRGDLL